MRDYPWEMVQVRYTIGGDNGPVDPDLPAMVQRLERDLSTRRAW